MNKTEKLICLFLGMALVWCFLSGRDTQPPKEAEKAVASAESKAPADGAANAPANTAAVAEAFAPNAVVAAEMVVAEAKKAIEMYKPDVPEETNFLENAELKLQLTTWGAGVKKATLKNFAEKAGAISDTNPAVVLDYTAAPLGVLEGVDGLPYMAAYGVKEKGDDYIIFTNGVAKIERKITLKPGYKVVIDDSFGEPSRLKDGNTMSMGVMTMGKSSDDILSIDGRTAGEDGDVMYYGTDDEASPKLYSLLSGGTSGGCGCGGPRKLQAGEPVAQAETVNGKHDWIALKDRFFVTALVKSSQDNKGFTAKVNRDIEVNDVYRPYNAGVDVLFGGGVEKRTTEFFVGPKEQSLMGDNNMKEVMDFGFWSFLCYPMVWILNFFEDIIPNYGVAIILLTILVRLVFWPLTRKSTEGMKKMQEIQPLLKELQAKFKDNPQRLQQETIALYREKKVNPFSSCLPMLIQIPIFIALFNVLRSMVELRYAGFLWIDDLSAPEHLFASWFPFGGLNILPILMAATMYLQSKLTPSAGDPNQQRMMTVIMPIMMLVMFYNFASALSLYWTVSQVLSIVQMWMMRRKTARKDNVLEPEVIDPPSTTRQMRRHS